MGLLSGMFNAVLDALKGLIWWLWESMVSGLSWFWDGLTDAIQGLGVPLGQWADWWETVSPLLVWLNYWFPFNLAMSLVGAYFAVLVSVASVRWVLRFIPTMGG